jgi:hypothetical protein
MTGELLRQKSQELAGIHSVFQGFGGRVVSRELELALAKTCFAADLAAWLHHEVVPGDALLCPTVSRSIRLPRHFEG